VVVARTHKGLGSEDLALYGPAPRSGDGWRVRANSRKIECPRRDRWPNRGGQSVFHGGGHFRRVTRLYQRPPSDRLPDELSDISNLTGCGRFPLTQAPRAGAARHPVRVLARRLGPAQCPLTVGPRGSCRRVRWTDYALPRRRHSVLDRGLTGRELKRSDAHSLLV